MFWAWIEDLERIIRKDMDFQIDPIWLALNGCHHENHFHDYTAFDWRDYL